MSLLVAETPGTRRPIVMIGAGGIVCDAHLPAYRKAGFDVAGIFDKDLVLAKSIAARFGISYTPASLEEAVAGKQPEWTEEKVEGTWFPDAFIGPMSDLMCFLDGVTDTLPTSVEDAYRTMAVVEAAYESSASEGTRIAYD